MIAALPVEWVVPRPRNVAAHQRRGVDTADVGVGAGDAETGPVGLGAASRHSL